MTNFNANDDELRRDPALDEVKDILYALARAKFSAATEEYVREEKSGTTPVVESMLRHQIIVELAALTETLVKLSDLAWELRSKIEFIEYDIQWANRAATDIKGDIEKVVFMKDSSVYGGCETTHNATSCGKVNSLRFTGEQYRQIVKDQTEALPKAVEDARRVENAIDGLLGRIYAKLGCTGRVAFDGDPPPAAKPSRFR